ncbi:MAG: hypothetical protein FJ302_15515 [Planctomycetes bacterium]|nr:hypothetical protein [Planctomycetota bacterium]
MIHQFYCRFSKHLVALVLLTQLPLVIWTLGVKTNNDTETWMPESSPARQQFEQFKRIFSAEEFLLIAFDLSRPDAPDARLIESVCGRLERLPSVRRAASPDRLRAIMRELEVPSDQIEERLKGLLVSRSGPLIGVAVTLSEVGTKNRSQTVADIRGVLEYCGLDEDRSMLVGAPLFAAELDRLGGKKANSIYFVITLTICLSLLYLLIREWRLTGLVYSVTVWTINATNVLLDVVGFEMNFVLSAIPVLTMVLTMAVCVHYLYYFQEATEEGATQPVVRALQLAWWPTCIATLTTCLGELALSISDLAPIRNFSYASAISSLMSMVCGLGLTPALLVVCPTLPKRKPENARQGLWLANAIVSRSPKIVFATLLLTVIAGAGLPLLTSDMTVSEFLPSNSKVKQDFLRVTDELATTDSIEAVINCGTDSRPFVEKLAMVRRIEGRIQQHPNVDQTLSLTRFFPKELPSDPIKLGLLLKRAESRRTEDEFTAHGQELWRVSVRVRVPKDKTRGQVIDELAEQLRDEPVMLTGLSALVDSAKQEIFDSFTQSVFMALGLITIAMMLFLRSVWRGFLTMVPNVAPLVWIYGGMAWLGIPIDIAIMLSGSIALGLSVDGTFHFMSRFRFHQHRAELEAAAVDPCGKSEQIEPMMTYDSQSNPNAALLVLTKHRTPESPAAFAARHALMESSIPFIQSTLTATAGMFGLTLSRFAPTARFGWVMIALMLAALVGDVLMLPALLKVTNRRRRLLAAEATPTTSERPSVESAAA